MIDWAKKLKAEIKEWRRLLPLFDRPMATIDFETKSECKLKKYGSWIYSKHPSTEVMCMAYKLPGWDVPKLWHPAYPHLGIEAAELPIELFAFILAGGLVEAHNAFFERVIWTHVCIPKLKWPAVPVKSWRCSASRASAAALPRDLEGACKAMGLPVEKDMAGNRLMQKLSKPRKPRKEEKENWAREAYEKGLKEEPPMPTLWHESLEEFERLWAYCTQDVVAEEALSLSIPELPETELKLWQLDQKMNWTGIRFDLDLAKKALNCAALWKTVLNGELYELTGIGAATKRQQVKTWLKENEALDLPDTAAATVDWYLDRNEISGRARRVLEILKQVNRTSTRKYQAILDRCDPEDQRAHDGLMYHGASTGRWTGQGIQVQNFPRGEIADMDQACADLRQFWNKPEWLNVLYGEVMDFLSGLLRGTIIPADDCDLIAADYSAIEARCVLWEAGAEAALEVFKRGGDIYCLSGETEILTKEQGLCPIKLLAGQQATLLDGKGSWVSCYIKDHGIKETQKTTFALGNYTEEVWSTLNHKWVNREGQFVETSNLEIGQEIEKLSPKFPLEKAEYKKGVIHGLIYGDGSRDGKAGSYRIGIYSHKESYIPWLLAFKSSPAKYKTCFGKTDGIFFRIPKAFAEGRDLKALPNSALESQSYLLGFLRGWLAADGTVSTQPAASISSKKEGIKWIQKWAPIVGWLPVGVTKYPNETNLGLRKQELYRVHFQGSSLNEDDFLIAQHKERWKAKLPQKRYWKVRTQGEKRKERVFCPVVPTTHSFALGSLLHSGNCDMATGIYGFEVTKKDKAERQFGKQAVLGLGYGMGFVTFLLTCRKYKIFFSVEQVKGILKKRYSRYMEWVHDYLYPPLTKAGKPDKNKKRQASKVLRRLSEAREDPKAIMHELALMKYTVDVYRSRYPEVPAMWKEQEEAAIAAVKRWEEKVVEAQANWKDLWDEDLPREERDKLVGPKVKAGKTMWRVEHGFLCCILPSGRKLRYRDPQIKPTLTSWGEKKAGLRFMAVVESKWLRDSSYGGKLVENITQATARDIMGDAMLRADGSIYRPLMTVHDEVVAEVKKTQGDVQEFSDLLSEILPWASGCPITAEADRFARYRK